MNNKILLLKEPLNYSYICSIILFCFTLCSTLFLSYANKNIVSEVDGYNKKIEERDESLKNLENNEELQVYALLEANKKSLDLLKKRSQIVSYVQHLKWIARAYDLEISWFQMDWWVIRTQVEAKSDDLWVSYKKIVHFMKAYKENKKALFDIEPIKTFRWYDNLRFHIDFRIK